MEPLALGGKRAIVVEMPGHGLSSRPLRESAYDLRAMSDAVIAAMDGLDLQRYSIVGHSMGTAVALDLARRFPARVRRMALLSPLGLDRIRVTSASHLITPSIAMRLAPRAVPRAAVKAVLKVVHSDAHPPSERDVDFYWAPTAFPDFGYAMVALLRNFEWRAWATEELGAITAPALLVCGTQDPLVRYDAVVRRSVSMPAAKTIILSNVGHVPLAESPAEVVPEILRFLD
jgi:abhydrolase domain-containing protein 6